MRDVVVDAFGGVCGTSSSEMLCNGSASSSMELITMYGILLLGLKKNALKKAL